MEWSLTLGTDLWLTTSNIDIVPNSNTCLVVLFYMGAGEVQTSVAAANNFPKSLMVMELKSGYGTLNAKTM
ncbi:purple acid phosphatase 17 [Prunus dulcis]|uniref:Purple acid phosphatase 17 n=1 Tax=Prunus dulcis TaxID=3755 RepID=A0A5H2XRL2_PRUDU|nr:purple acid phosphatase 17 [Prunus dulcis]